MSDATKSSATGEQGTAGFGAPPVLAVVVVNDAGPSFSDTLESLAAQDYPNLSVLVIDNGSKEDPTETVGAILPNAVVKRLNHNVGFGPAANEAIGMVKGATFFLFCHDDVVLEPGATRALLEGAFRENAGIVGAKIVDWEDPRVLVEMGWSVDRFGFRTPVVQPGELDQGQHDSTRDTFAVSEAAMLVRADMFATVGGFSDDLAHFDADIDLCWRAHIAGARVVVAPGARARHLQAGYERPQMKSRRRLEYRARGRMLATNYTTGRSLRILPVAGLFSFIEMLGSALTLQFDRATDIIRAWVWNLAHLPSILRQRRQIAAFRTASDADVALFQVRGSAAISAFVRGTAVSGNQRINQAMGSSRSLTDRLRAGPDRYATLIWLAVLTCVTIGSRSLIGGRIPAIREFQESYQSAGDVVGAYVSGWRSTGLGGPSSPASLAAMQGLVGTVFFGSTALARWTLIVGLLPLGVLGAWWWLRDAKSSQLRAVAALVYVAVPVPYNSLAEGRYGALALWASLPWVVGLIGRAAGARPFASDDSTVSTVRYGAALAVVVALLAMVFPLGVFVVPLVYAVMVLGGLFDFSSSARWDRAGIATVIGVFGGVALQLPWIFEFFDGSLGWNALVGPQAVSERRLSVLSILTMNAGTNSAGWLPGLLCIGGALAIMVGKEWRFRTAMQGFVFVGIGVFLSWLTTTGTGPRLPAPEVTMTLIALGVALMAAASAGAFEADVAGGDFGWRQGLSILTGIALALGVLPLAFNAADGRWGLAHNDHAAVLRTLDSPAPNPNYRVLWLGIGDVLPVRGWELPSGVMYATTEGLAPHAGDLFPGGERAATAKLRQAIEEATTGKTTRLGKLLAPMGVRYVVMVKRYAPSSETTAEVAPSASFIRSIDSQRDLTEVPVSVALGVYENRAWVPTRATFPEGALDSAGRGSVSLLGLNLSEAEPVLSKAESGREFSGSVSAGRELYVSSPAELDWTLSVDGKDAKPTSVLGWASKFKVPGDGPATLRWSGSSARFALVAVQAVLWLAVLFVLLGRTVGRRLGLRREAPAPPPRRRTSAPEPAPARRSRSARPAPTRRSAAESGEPTPPRPRRRAPSATTTAEQRAVDAPVGDDAGGPPRGGRRQRPQARSSKPDASKQRTRNRPAAAEQRREVSPPAVDPNASASAPTEPAPVPPEPSPTSQTNDDELAPVVPLVRRRRTRREPQGSAAQAAGHPSAEPLASPASDSAPKSDAPVPPQSTEQPATRRRTSVDPTRAARERAQRGDAKDAAPVEPSAAPEAPAAPERAKASMRRATPAKTMAATPQPGPAEASTEGTRPGGGGEPPAPAQPARKRAPARKRQPTKASPKRDSSTVDGEPSTSTTPVTGRPRRKSSRSTAEHGAVTDPRRDAPRRRRRPDDGGES